MHDLTWPEAGMIAGNVVGDLRAKLAAAGRASARWPGDAACLRAVAARLRGEAAGWPPADGMPPREVAILAALAVTPRRERLARVLSGLDVATDATFCDALAARLDAGPGL